MVLLSQHLKRQEYHEFKASLSYMVTTTLPPTRKGFIKHLKKVGKGEKKKKNMSTEDRALL